MTRRRWARRCRATILVLTVLALSSLAGTARPATAQPTRDTRIRLVSQSPFVEPKGGAFVLRFRVEGAPDDAELEFRLFGSITEGRNRLLATIAASDTLGERAPLFRALPLANLPVDADGTYTATFAVDNELQPLLGLLLKNPGVYPFSIQVRHRDGDAVASLVTYIVRLPLASATPNPPFLASVIVPLRAPVAHQTDGAVNLGDRAGVLRERVAVLQRHPGVPLTIDATPETAAALVETGAVPAGDLRSIAAGRQVLAAPYVPVDLASWVTEPSLRADLDRQWAVGTQTLVDVFGTAPDTRTILVDRSTSVDVLTHLRGRGAQRAVVDERVLFPLPQKEFPKTLTRTFELDGPPGIRTDAGAADARLVAHLGETDDPVLAAVYTVADLAVLQVDQPALTRGALLRLPDDVPAAYLDALLTALTPAPAPAPVDATAPEEGTAPESATPATPATPAAPRVLAAATVDGYFGVVEPAGEKGGAAFSATGNRLENTLVRVYLPDPPAGLGQYPKKLAQAHASVASYRSLFADGPSRATKLDQLLLLSGAAGFDERRKQDHLDAAVGQVEAIRTRVSFPDQPAVTLTATEGRMPLAVDNNGPDELQVRLTLSSDKLEFPDAPDGRSRLLTLAPGPNRLDLPVRAKGSGVFQVDATLTSPDGSLPLATTKFEMRSTAVSGWGLAISIGAGVFLALWWARHILQEWRARSEPPPAPPAPPAVPTEREPVPV